MSDKFSDAINISIRAYNRERALLPAKLGNEAESHFKDSWRKQGWEGGSWKPRKSSRDNAGRAILVKSGRLRRDFTVKSTFRQVTVTNHTPYSVYHNYGTKRLPKRRFMGKSNQLDYKSGILIMRMIKRALR